MTATTANSCYRISPLPRESLRVDTIPKDMNQKGIITTISKAILESKNELFFERQILEKLDENDQEYFLEIWQRTLAFENWNYKDLSIGFEKTVHLIKTEFQLNEEVAHVLANKASYEWK